MPKRSSLEIDPTPYQFKNKKLRMNKAYTEQQYKSDTILTDDVFTYIDFYFGSHKKTMKYNDVSLKNKYGDPNKYHYAFYWKQAMTFYTAAKTLPIESSPLAAYYSMLNAAKALISFKSKNVDVFINDFNAHGLAEDKSSTGESLDSITIKRYDFGVFVHLGRTLEKNFDNIWPKNTPWNMKKLLYNLAFLHRAYVTTYTDTRGKKIQEQFIPLVRGESPTYHKGNDSNLYLKVKFDKGQFSPSASTIPSTIITGISTKFETDNNERFTLKSQKGAKRNSKDSLSSEFKELNKELRKEFQYIKSSKRLWYLKLTNLNNPDIINVNSMLISFALMHRFSEIVRYKPEQMARLMKSKENWLIHEFLTHALDQFIDEIAAEITGQDIMCTGIVND